MKCRFCNKEFENFMELNKHELECWKAKCELERRQKEKEEIERRKAEEERKLREEINQRGKELLDLRNKFVVECNRFRNDFEHTKWFSTWEDMLIDDNTTIKFNNGSTIKKINCHNDNVRSKRGDEQLKHIDDNTKIVFKNGSNIETISDQTKNSRSKRSDKEIENFLKTLLALGNIDWVSEE